MQKSRQLVHLRLFSHKISLGKIEKLSDDLFKIDQAISLSLEIALEGNSYTPSDIYETSANENLEYWVTDIMFEKFYNILKTSFYWNKLEVNPS